MKNNLAFQIGERVRLKKADSTDPRNDMRIKQIGNLKRIDQALCGYIKNPPIQHLISSSERISEPLDEWFALSELEHVSGAT